MPDSPVVTAPTNLPPDIPATMPAAVFQGIRDVTVEELPTPQLGPTDVLLEVSHCGICGSDLHFVVHWPGAGKPGTVEGHEFSGTIVAVGSDVPEWRVGDRVVGGPTPRCGRCEYCLAQRPSLCLERGRVGADEGGWMGAFARYKKMRADQVLRVPDNVAMRHAALVEPLAVALHGITRSGGADPAKRYLVTGGGPIGFLSVAALRAAGVTDIVVSEPHASRRALCEKLGARTMMPDELEMPAMPHDLVAEPFDVVLECSGHKAAIESALSQLKRAGVLVLVGAGISKPKFDSNRILLNELMITGAFVYDYDGFPRALELLASGKLPLDDLVEPGEVGLEGLVDACVALNDGELAAKVMVVPGRSS
ncbi:MAG TPA: alcohol dehydrogenase catalytic domain-containing protein [Acidimicrobiia bacterium]